MKILIIGDTHAQDDVFLRVLAKEREFDALLHTGDFEGSELVYRELVDVPFYYIAGNNDFFTDAPYERVFELESVRIYMAHGHRHNAFEGGSEIRKAAARHHAQIAVYGHSHVPSAGYSDGILLLNPGSLAWPRQDNHNPCYIVLELRDGKAESYEIRYLEQN